MLKMDFLGLKTLSVIHEAEHWIRKRIPDFDLSTVELDDVRTFEMLKRGETVAVFQMESGGMVNTCRQLGPDRIEEIIAILALYRPGPMQFIPDYIKRKKGEEKVEYPHPLLEKIAKETYGILVYQEQVQQAANVLAGYTLGQADILRRAMGKKDLKEMAEQRLFFVAGCGKTHGIPPKQANEVFDLLEKFAQYGFNKSHSAAYGIVTYRTAYLKANFPVEFMAAVLSYEVNNTDKIAGFVSECQRMGVEILPPDINRSSLKFSPEMKPGETVPHAIRFGLSAIKNVGEGGMQSAIAEREAHGDFRSLEDFANRLDSKAVNKRMLEALVKTGAFDFCNEARHAMFNRLDVVISSASAAQKDRRSGQASLFDFDLGGPPPTQRTERGDPKTEGQEPAEWSKADLIGFEKELLGFYVSGHPLDPYRGNFDSPKLTRIVDIEEINEKQTITVAGLLQTVEVRYTKKDNRAFATLVLEDFTGSIEAMCWSETYEKCKELLKPGSVVAVRAVCEKDSRTEMNRLTAKDVKPLKPKKANPRPVQQEQALPESEPQLLTLRLNANKHPVDDVERIRDILLQHPGDVPVQIVVSVPGKEDVTIEAGERYSVEQTTDLVKDLTPWM
jgi:DNA polymerase-3 subunit alpha